MNGQRLDEVLQRIGEVLQRIGEVPQRIGEVLQRLREVLQRIGEVLQRIGEVLQRLREGLQRLGEGLHFKYLGATCAKNAPAQQKYASGWPQKMAAIVRSKSIWRSNTISITSKFKTYKSLITSLRLCSCQK